MFHVIHYIDAFTLLLSLVKDDPAYMKGYLVLTANSMYFAVLYTKYQGFVTSGSSSDSNSDTPSVGLRGV